MLLVLIILNCQYELLKDHRAEEIYDELLLCPGKLHMPSGLFCWQCYPMAVTRNLQESHFRPLFTGFSQVFQHSLLNIESCTLDHDNWWQTLKNELLWTGAKLWARWCFWMDVNSLLRFAICVTFAQAHIHSQKAIWRAGYAFLRARAHFYITIFMLSAIVCIWCACFLRAHDFALLYTSNNTEI